MRLHPNLALSKRIREGGFNATSLSPVPSKHPRGGASDAPSIPKLSMLGAFDAPLSSRAL